MRKRCCSRRSMPPLKHGISFSRDGLTIFEANADRVALELARIITYFKFDARVGDYVPKSPPDKIVKGVIAKAGQYTLPVLRGIVNNPLMLSDGSIIQREGYNEGSGYYLDFRGTTFSPISENPTTQDVKKA